MFIFRKNSVYAMIALIGLCFFCTACQHLLYHPSSHFYVKAQQLSPQPKDVFIAVNKNEKLHAWFFKRAKKFDERNAIIVHFHGNGQNLSTHFSLGSWLTEYGFDYLVFDYRGYGQSEGEPSTKNTVEDGMQVLRYVASQYPNKKLIVLAQSLGGNVALRSLVELKGELVPQLVIVEASFLSYREAGDDVLSRFWLTWPFQWASYLLLSDRWAAGPVVDALKGPEFLVVHSVKDEIIDYERGRELYDRLAGPKTFIELSSGGHIEAFSQGSEVNRVNLIQFLKSRGL